MSNPFQCTARRCADISGVGPQADVTLYNLQDRLFFNGVPLSFILTCQPGYVCPPGLFPRVVTYPPGTFVIPFPPTGGFPIVLQLQGCQSLVTRTLDADATADEIAAAANEIILEVAAQQAVCDAESFPGVSPEPAFIEMTDAPEFLCDDFATEFTISANTTGPITFLLFEGSLPTGMVMSSDVGGTSFTISGTPTTMGTYVFTIYAMKSGAFGSKTFSVIVGGITTASPLPNATIDTEYTEVLASNLTGTLSWSVVGGAAELPSWMSLNETTGTLFGTPTEGSEGTFSFTISVTNGTKSCEKEFELEVEAAAVCAELFADTVWGQISSYQDNGATTVASGTGTDFDSVSTSPEAEALCATPVEVIRGTFKDFEGVISYTGPEIECCLRATVSGTPYYNNTVAPGIGATSTCSGYVQVYVDGGAILMDEDFFDNANNGTFDYGFTIPECLVPTNIVVASGTSADTSASTDLSCFYPDQTAPQAEMTIAIRLGVC
jgi:hypothetical protein